MKHNTKQWYRNEFSRQKIKHGEQLKHRNIMNEILWFYDIKDVYCNLWKRLWKKFM